MEDNLVNFDVARNNEIRKPHKSSEDFRNFAVSG